MERKERRYREVRAFMTFLLTAVNFLFGSLMFSYWLGLFAGKNLRTIGDGNPGAANLWRAKGFKLGSAGVVLDFLKGYLLIALIIKSGHFTGYVMIPIALAPILGHVFSPFLQFKGGKAVAVTFGVWSALTTFEVALVYGAILAIMHVVTMIFKKGKSPTFIKSSFQIVFGMLLLSVYLYKEEFSEIYLWIWLGNLLILLYSNKNNLIKFFIR
jgi:acyl phosphate:glycerol-3-phosphate acyltransferase